MLGKVQASLTLPSLKRAFQGCVSFPTLFHRSAKGQKLAALKQSALLTLYSGRSLNGKEPRPGSHAAGKVPVPN